MTIINRHLKLSNNTLIAKNVQKFSDSLKINFRYQSTKKYQKLKINIENLGKLYIDSQTGNTKKH